MNPPICKNDMHILYYVLAIFSSSNQYSYSSSCPNLKPAPFYTSDSNFLSLIASKAQALACSFDRLIFDIILSTDHNKKLLKCVSYFSRRVLNLHLFNYNIKYQMGQSNLLCPINLFYHFRPI